MNGTHEKRFTACANTLVATLATALVAASGCGAANDDSGGGSLGTESGGGTGGTGASAGTGGTGGTGSTATGAGAGGTGSGGVPGTKPSDPAAVEMLDPNVDWTALTLVYPNAYSAFVPGITFQVPFYVDGATIELADWSAIPASAVSFDPDPESGGVLVTVLEDVPEITIAARSGMIGGTAPLFITSGTLEQWETGKARYANGVELNIMFDAAMTAAEFAMLLLDPNYMPPTPPPDLACNNCHTTGAKYFEIQHTPTQAARLSDDDLRTILTTGMKPAGAGFRVIPEDQLIFGMTAEELYSQFHKWEATEDEIIGLIVYLRSLTPTGQGDILLPDGTYVAPGELPPGFGGM